MAYEGEFASYRPLYRIAESERVKSLLQRTRVREAELDVGPRPEPVTVPETAAALPDFIVAIDGSNAEVPVKTGYPGAQIGYCTVASVLLDLAKIRELDLRRPASPVEFRMTEQLSTADVALPGSNVVTRDHVSARDSFRESLFEEFASEIPDIEDGKSILSTYEELLKLKPKTKLQSCPYATDLSCEEHFNVSPGLSSCACSRRLAVYSTDALRIYERFHDVGSNGEALGEVMQVWERILLVHIIRSFERRGWLASLRRLGFVMDGPLAFFGHPAWMSAAVSSELKRLNVQVRAATGQDMLIFGIEKSGIFVDHFTEIDQTETSGKLLFEPRTCFMPSDYYIKNRIIYSKSDKRYGADTYFGRKLFYKTSSGARIVVNIPFLSDGEDNLESDDIAQYAQIPLACALLDKLVSSRFENAVTPIVAANAAAAIPLNLGAKVLQQLAHALMRDE
jgi:hypothetical protein